MTDHETIEELLRIKAHAPIRFNWHTSALIVVDVPALVRVFGHVRQSEEIVTMMAASMVAA